MTTRLVCRSAPLPTTYSHCRGCGVELAHDGDRENGLCLYADGNGCTWRFVGWVRATGRRGDLHEGAAAIDVSIDSWLMAGTP